MKGRVPCPVSQQRLLIGVIISFATAGFGLLALAGSQPFAGPRPTAALPLGGVSFTSDRSDEASSQAMAASNTYVHPTEAFAVSYPPDWQVDDAENEARFVGPNDEAEIVIWFTTSEGPVKLDSFLQQWLEDRYGGYDDFEAGKQITQTDGSLLQVASFTGDDQIRRAANAIGEEHGGIVYVGSFVAMIGLHDAYLPLFITIANSFKYNVSAALAVASLSEGP